MLLIRHAENVILIFKYMCVLCIDLCDVFRWVNTKHVTVIWILLSAHLHLNKFEPISYLKLFKSFLSKIITFYVCGIMCLLAVHCCQTPLTSLLGRMCNLCIVLGRRL